MESSCKTLLPFVAPLFTHILHDLQGRKHHVDADVALPLSLRRGIRAGSIVRDRVAVIEVIQRIAHFLGLIQPKAARTAP